MRHSLQVSAQRSWLLLAMLVATFWPVWGWLIARASDSSGAMWELASLATVVLYIAIAWRERRYSRLTSFPIGMLLLLYAALYSVWPPLVRASIAMMAIALALSAVCFEKRCDVPLCGLLLLSLPLIESLNFYLGFPLRVAVGAVTQALLNLDGFAVVREGTVLHWGGRLVSIDAPCSGIKMLWAGLYLSFTLSAFLRLTALRTLLLAIASIIAVLAANVARATALFFVEADVVHAAKEWHDYIGIVVFLCAALMVVHAAHYLKTDRYAH